VSKCVHLINCQRKNSWHIGVFPSQFSNAAAILSWYITHGYSLEHPRPEVLFAQVEDDTITALAQLATIFKNKFQKPSVPELMQAPLNAAENKQPAALAQPILTFRMQHNYQTRSQRPISVNTSRNTPLLLRVVTPMTGHDASPRVLARAQHLSPRILSWDDFWNMETANQSIALVTNHWKNQHFFIAVLHPVTGKEMEYMALMEYPDLQTLWKIGLGFGIEMGWLCQGIRYMQVTNTCFFVELKNIPKDRNKIVCDYKPHRKEKDRVRLTVGSNRLDYSRNVATSTSDITTFNFLINNTMSTKDAEMMMMDIKNYYMGTILFGMNTCTYYYPYFQKKL
jgi:hypothetical protein